MRGVALRARAGPGPGLRNRGPGILGLAQNPVPACQVGPGFEARPRVHGPRVNVVSPGPGFKALDLDRPGPGPARALKLHKLHYAIAVQGAPL